MKLNTKILEMVKEFLKHRYTTNNRSKFRLTTKLNTNSTVKLNSTLTTKLKLTTLILNANFKYMCNK